MNQQEESDLNPREEKIWTFYQQGRDAYWIAAQFDVTVATITQWLLDIQRKVGEEKA